MSLISIRSKPISGINNAKTPCKMPGLKRESLAIRLRQNWLSKYPADLPTPPGDLDDSLTSLSWLQNLNIMKITSPSATTGCVLNGDENRAPNGMRYPGNVNPNAVLDMGPNVKQEPGLEISCTALKPVMEVSPPPCSSPGGLERADYKTNPYVKPPYSYATLICMAMKESKKNKITLSGIYSWITENFLYYKMADPSWQNSIRHNLSLNKCFQKVARRKDEPGKGGFWRINPEFEDMFVDGIFKKRRGSTLREPIAPCAKRVKKETEDSNSSATYSSEQSPVANALQSIEEQALIKAAATASKREAVLQLGSAAVDIGDALDLSWSAILNQDIDVGGVRVKTEDIIDGHENVDSVADTITSLSPPPSDSSSDVALEELLTAGLGSDMDSPFDFTTGDALDLTVSGTCIRRPEGWHPIGTEEDYPHTGLSTPIAPSPVADMIEYASHPWADHRSELDQAIASLDTEIQSLLDSKNDPTAFSL